MIFQQFNLLMQTTRGPKNVRYPLELARAPRASRPTRG